MRRLLRLMKLQSTHKLLFWKIIRLRNLQVLLQWSIKLILSHLNKN